MMNRGAFLLSVAVAASAALLMSRGSLAHGIATPPKLLPLSLLRTGHVSSTYASLLLGHGLGKLPATHAALSSAAALHMPALSAGARSVYNINKLFVQNSINSSFTSAYQGQIASGNITGTIYENNLQGFSYSIGPFVFATGKTPFNNTLPYGSPIPAGLSTSNFFSFVPSTTTTTTVTGGIVPVVSRHGVLPLITGRQHVLPLSTRVRPLSLNTREIVRPLQYSAGSTRIQNYFRELAGSSSKIGVNLGSSPIVGGRFSGVTYGTTASVLAPNYLSNSVAVYAFGNDPYNNGQQGVVVGPFNVPAANYLRFANGLVVKYTSGFFEGNSYLPSQGITNGPFIFAIGSNKYASWPGYQVPFVFKNFTSYLTGAPTSGSL